MTTYFLRFIEAFRLEEVPITKRKVFPRKKMAESIKEGICRGKFRFAPSEKDLEVQIKVTSYLIQNSPGERTKNIQIAAGLSGNCPK